MGMRTNTAQWLPNQNRWQIKVQKDGVRKTFTSAKPGRTGQREANAKADAWLDEGICSTTKRCLEVWNEYLISVRATAGTSYAPAGGEVRTELHPANHWRAAHRRPEHGNAAGRAESGIQRRQHEPAGHSKEQGKPL